MAVNFPDAPTAGEIFERWRWDTDKWIPSASTSTPYLPLSGGVMSGPIVLAGNAAANLQAVPLQQLNQRLALYLPLTGGALSGSLSVTGTMVATGLVQGNPINSTGDLTAGGNIGTNGVVYAGAVQSGAFYGNPTFTGSVTVNGNISTPNGVYAALVQAPTLAGSVTVTGNFAAAGNISTVNTVVAGAVQTPQLNGNVYVTGNLNSGGQVQGDSLYARNRVDVVNGVFCNGLFQSSRGDDYAFYAPYGGCTIATAFVSNRGGGQLGLYIPYADAHVGGSIGAGGNVTGNGVYGNYVHSNGNMDAAGDINAGGRVFIGTASAGDFYLQGGGDRWINMASGYLFIWQGSTGNMWWQNNNGQQWVMAVDGWCFNNVGPVAGHGDFVNLSDRRFKDESTITPTTKGLAEILLLEPVEFKRLPTTTQPDAPPPLWELGFVAQDVAEALPEAVSIAGILLPDGSGGRDTADPTLGVTVGAIVAAMCNAFKELDTRLKALEGA
jgi:hypothetical protein